MPRKSKFERVCERSMTHEVDVGCGVKVPVRLNPDQIYMLKAKGRFPNALEPEMKYELDGVNVTAKRTPIGLEALEGIIDEFPDSIAETISRVLENE